MAHGKSVLAPMAMLLASTNLGMPSHPRRRGRKRQPLTPEQLESMRVSADQARTTANDAKIAAERKRLKKAEKLRKLAEKGAIGTVEKREETLTLPAKHSSIVMGGPKETKSERDARKKREKRAAEKAARLQNADG